jgi:hypothetical protein
LQATKTNILQIVKDLGCIQIDPINILAPSHHLVIWSRLGPFNLQDLEELLWEEHQLFEDWGHCTSIVPTEDYPIFFQMKREWKAPAKYQEWIKQNQSLRRHILSEITKHGPLPTNHFQDKAKVDWPSSGWTSGRNVAQMLTYLWVKGKIMVARREGNTKFWDLTDRVLPPWTPKTHLTSKGVRLLIAQKALQALGVAQPSHLRYYYIRGVPKNIDQILAKLEEESLVEKVEIQDPEQKVKVRGRWYIHRDQIPLIEELSDDKWTNWMRFLSPFDNLISERKRIEQLFHFRYRLEIYVPQNKRQYGPYTLPILYGDRFIGRLDAKLNRKTMKLEIIAIHPELTETQSGEIGDAIHTTINNLAIFLNAESIDYVGKQPRIWKK